MKPLVIGLESHQVYFEFFNDLMALHGGHFERKDVWEKSDLINRTILVFGKNTWRRLDYPMVRYFDRLFGSQGNTFILFPHPSIKNQFYNKSRSRFKVIRYVRRLAR